MYKLCYLHSHFPLYLTWYVIIISRYYEHTWIQWQRVTNLWFMKSMCILLCVRNTNTRVIVQYGKKLFMLLHTYYFNKRIYRLGTLERLLAGTHHHTELLNDILKYHCHLVYIFAPKDPRQLHITLLTDWVRKSEKKISFMCYSL